MPVHADREEHRRRELADFLKTRRANISPSQAGLPDGSRRRTPGLRREEVAQLAGVGLTWYTWLEQGRPIQASAQVIDNLARVLLLDRQERIHLCRLANQPIPADISERPPVASPTLRHLLDSLPLCPSMIADRHWNVVAWNRAARMIFGKFSEAGESGESGESGEMGLRERNIVWAMFADDRYKTLFTDWELHARELLGRFRATCGQYVEGIPGLPGLSATSKRRARNSRHGGRCMKSRATARCSNN